jgi:hypothetical protein
VILKAVNDKSEKQMYHRKVKTHQNQMGNGLFGPGWNQGSSCVIYKSKSGKVVGATGSNRNKWAQREVNRQGKMDQASIQTSGGAKSSTCYIHTQGCKNGKHLHQRRSKDLWDEGIPCQTKAGTYAMHEMQKMGALR